jgi:uncharacterized membrane protein HdeD (DUF308 family)
MDQKIYEQLQRVEGTLREIRDNTANSWWLFLVSGALRGIGFTVGTVIAVALVGWLLSIFGIIPGLSELSHYLRPALDSQSAL